ARAAGRPRGRSPPAARSTSAASCRRGRHPFRPCSRGASPTDRRPSCAHPWWGSSCRPGARACCTPWMCLPVFVRVRRRAHARATRTRAQSTGAVFLKEFLAHGCVDDPARSTYTVHKTRPIAAVRREPTRASIAPHPVHPPRTAYGSAIMRAATGTRTARLGALAGLAVAALALAGCAPTGTESERVEGVVVSSNPHLATDPTVPTTVDIVYRTIDGQPVHLDACRPPDFDPRTDPARAALIVVHGGSWMRGSKNDVAWRAVCQWLAKVGYPTFSLDYRLAP